MKTRNSILIKWIIKQLNLSKVRFLSSNYSKNTKLTEIKGSPATSKTVYHDLNFVHNILHNDRNDKENKSNISYEIEKTNLQKKGQKGQLIVIVLNNTLEIYAYNIITRADFLVCADGGANRLYDLTLKMEEKIGNILNKEREREISGKERTSSETELRIGHSEQKRTEKCSSGLGESYHSSDQSHSLECSNFSDSKFPSLLPNLICGDFDSIKENVYGFYKQKGCIRIERNTDPSNTDLDKCLDKIKNIINENDKILILGATGNRFDHACANIKSLYNYASLENIYLLGEDNFLFLLNKGKNVIYVDQRVFKKNCGLLPIGEKCIVTTTGLKYNLNNEQLSFDTIISSSNEITEEKVQVISSAPLLWFSQLKRTTYYN